MTPFYAGVTIGMFVGAFLGIVIFSLLLIARDCGRPWSAR